MADNMKSKLLCVACDVIAQRGVEGMRTRHVAEAAGVSTALLHYHYGSKRDLIFASFGYSDDLAIATIRSRVDSNANGREQLAAAPACVGQRRRRDAASLDRLDGDLALVAVRA